MNVEIFTDGGSRGNPGQAACAFVVRSSGSVIYREGHYLGVMTNNEAEYLGVVMALHWVTSSTDAIEHISWKLDSQLVVEQINGKWRIKELRLQALHTFVQQLLSKTTASFDFSYVPRAENSAADALVNQVLDRHKQFSNLG